MNRYWILQGPFGTKAVKIGWSWPAFCFGMLWLLAKKFFIKFFFVLALAIVLFMINPTLSFIGSFFFCLILGRFGNKWRLNYFKKKYAYLVKGKVKAPSENAAIVVYRHSLR